MSLTLMENMTSIEHMLMVLVLLMVILVNISEHLWLLIKNMFSMMIAVMRVPVLLSLLNVPSLISNDYFCEPGNSEDYEYNALSWESTPKW